MPKTYVKQALLTGVGSLFLDFLKTEDEPTKAPTYDGKAIETPTIDKVAVALELAEKKVYLSNILHTDVSAVKLATITLDAGYLPAGFAEEAQGMIKMDGAWAMPTNPVKKLFRMAFPITDENGDELIMNFPKCSLSPVDVSAETEREDVSEQLAQFNIVGMPLVYKTENGKMFVYHKIDLAVEENKSKYDRDKLLVDGWFDKESLAKAAKSGLPGG